MAFNLATQTGGSITRTGVLSAVDDYEKYHTQHGGDEKQRKSNYTDMVNKYYDLATSFYEYGWGEAFHFAHRWNNESLRESIKRHEHFLALNLELKPGQKVLDVGCGIGGPLREIAAFSGAHVTGLNNNAYQISRGQVLNQRAGLNKTCDFLKADFMSVPKPDNTYDAVYAIEATCHAPDLVACYAEIKRVLKPGQYFSGYEWVLTDAYDGKNEAHKKCKEDIEIGNGLPDIRSGIEVAEALKAAGFEVIRVGDLVQTAQVPWYLPLDPDHFSFSSFRLTRVGRFITRSLMLESRLNECQEALTWQQECLEVRVLETIGLAPHGSMRISNFLETACHGLVDGGKRELFSPLFFFLARKPTE